MYSCLIHRMLYNETDDNNVNFGNKFTFILLQMHLIWIWDGEEHALKVPCCKIVVHGQRLTPPVHLGNPSNPVSRLKFRSILSGRVWIGWFSARKINQEILCRCSLSLIWADQREGTIGRLITGPPLLNVIFINNILIVLSKVTSVGP